MIGTGRSFKWVPRRACLLIRTGANSVRQSTKTANFTVLRQYFCASTALLCPVETWTRVHKPVIRNCTLLCTLWNHVGTCEARHYLCRVTIGLKSGAPNRYRTHNWKFVVAPTFSIDFVDSETVNIVGVSLAKGL